MLDFIYEETINAPADAVFDVIADLSAYKDWNPFVTAETGQAGINEVITGKSFLGGKAVSYRHRIYEMTPGRSLCWRDFGFPALFVCGDRARYVEERDGKTHYTCHLRVTGPLSFVASMLFANHLKQGVAAECRALKHLLEKISDQ